MASLTSSIIWSALLTLSLLINLHCIVEARESMYFSRFPGNENSPKGGESDVKDYKGNYGADGVRDVNNGFGSESGDSVRGGVGYASGSGTAYEEPDNAYVAGSSGAYGSQKVRKEGTGASHKEDSTITVPSFESAEGQKNGGAGFGNGYGSHSMPYRRPGSRDEAGTVYGSTSRYEHDDEFPSGYGVRSGSNSRYDSSYNSDSGYGRSFGRNGYNPGSREYDRNAYSSNLGGGGGYEQTGSGYGEYVSGGN